MKALLQGFDAIFIGTGAPRGRDLPNLPGRKEGDANIHVGIEWLASVAYGHMEKVGELVIGGGNTAMDCCRMARLGGKDRARRYPRCPLKDECLTLGDRGRPQRGYPDRSI